MKKLLTLAHSPDPDDAFMWWPLADFDERGPAIDVGDYVFELVMEDIETLNEKSEQGIYDITAISIAHYPAVASTYDLTACGASLGDGYGPKVVSKSELTMDELIASGASFAIPGERTSALAALKILAGSRPIRWESIPFEQIMETVLSEKFDAGVVIHEGQLTYQTHGLYEICDLGQWWYGKTGLPIPLGGNVIKKDIESRYGVGTTSEVTKLLLQSIEYSMAHRERSLDWAKKWGRGIDLACTDKFVDMYVNKWTLDFGATGEKAVQRFLSEAAFVGAVCDIESAIFV
ncbi:MAG: MqnA/MqnD/SBP family protein [Planctomycetota bacterium]|nr:MqnA/MqnD/SBP family protein [Planctomycetota bacterium]